MSSQPPPAPGAFPPQLPPHLLRSGGAPGGLTAYSGYTPAGDAFTQTSGPGGGDLPPWALEAMELRRRQQAMDEALQRAQIKAMKRAEPRRETTRPSPERGVQERERRLQMAAIRSAEAEAEAAEAMVKPPPLRPMRGGPGMIVGPRSAQVETSQLTGAQRRAFLPGGASLVGMDGGDGLARPGISPEVERDPEAGAGGSGVAFERSRLQRALDQSNHEVDVRRADERSRRGRTPPVAPSRRSSGRGADSGVPYYLAKP